MPVGAPSGNQNAIKGKRWAQALERAYAAWPNPPDNDGCSALICGLNAAAHQFVKRTMLEGDIAFFKETGDRFDGKAHQSTSIANEDGTPLLSGVTVSFVKPDSSVS